MFPETDELLISENTVENTGGTKSFLYDFSKGDFVIRDGKLVPCDSLEAIKVWIEKIIRTEKNRFPIYDGTEYGCYLEDLIIGNNYTVEFVEAELKREIEDALLQHPKITSIGSFTLHRDKTLLSVTLEVNISDEGTNTVTVAVKNQ